MTNPTTPTSEHAPVAYDDVIAELQATPVGALMWDNAYLRVVTGRQEEELRYLRSLQAPTADAAPDAGGS